MGKKKRKPVLSRVNSQCALHRRVICCCHDVVSEESLAEPLSRIFRSGKPGGDRFVDDVLGGALQMNAGVPQLYPERVGHAHGRHNRLLRLPLLCGLRVVHASMLKPGRQRVKGFQLPDVSGIVPVLRMERHA